MPAPFENRSIICRLNAGISSGLRLVTTPLLKTTSSSTQVPPAFRISVLREGQEVTVRPCTAPASTSIQGPWQIAATGLRAQKSVSRSALQQDSSLTDRDSSLHPAEVGRRISRDRPSLTWCLPEPPRPNPSCPSL